jgi:vitamin K-dependent gamma-carboxylase
MRREKQQDHHRNGAAGTPVPAPGRGGAGHAEGVSPDGGLHGGSRLSGLFRPVEIAPLVYFRIVGGALMMAETIGQLVTDYRTAYVGGAVHFHYTLLPWLEPWPPAGIYVHLAVNIAAAALVTLGLHTRVAAAVFGLGTLSLLLMEQTVYINHTYLYGLTGLLLAAMPCGQAVSLDVRRGAVGARATAPAWCLLLLRFQLAVVYVYGGIAKLDPDWLATRAVRVWLERIVTYPIVGPLFALPAVPYLLSWGGLIFDLMIIPAMLWPRTRRGAFAIAIAFHMTNVVMFGLGTFPWFALAMTALYFEPSAFRRMRWLGQRLPPAPAAPACETSAAPLTAQYDAPSERRRAILFALATYCALQVLVPLRMQLYPAWVSWTEQGHKFSWRMMLRTKSGGVRFEVREPRSGRTWSEHPMRYLTARQYSHMYDKPELIRQFAHYLADEYERRGHVGVEVRARAMAGLNGRRPRHLVDPDVNLAAEPASLRPYSWITPAPRP